MTFTIRGRRVRTQSRRRFIVVVVNGDATHVVKRTDSRATAVAAQTRERSRWHYTTPIVVLDTTTGEEI